ncbi:hypothetical protein M2149_000954 [Lachnospiraceae bacterium PFB1-21]
MNNLYWSIYKNLEREVLNLADLVYFSDNQITVHSIRIADIIVRCAVEIESLIGDLYNGAIAAEEEETSVGKKLVALNEKICLEKKQVTIISLNMHFSAGYATFSPFSYKKGDENDFYSAYNAIKHNRVANFEAKATIHYLLRSLAALFVLNIYYKNEDNINLGSKRALSNANFGSDIFSVYATLKTPIKYTGAVTQNSEDQKALYIIKAEDGAYRNYLKEVKRAHLLKIKALPNEMQEKINKQNDQEEGGESILFKYDTNFVDLVRKEEIGTEEFVKLVSKLSEIDSKPVAHLSTLPFEAILNKNQIIYPEIEEDK